MVRAVVMVHGADVADVGIPITADVVVRGLPAVLLPRHLGQSAAGKWAKQHVMEIEAD